MGMSVGYGSVGWVLCLAHIHTHTHTQLTPPHHRSDEDRLKVLDRAWEIGCVNWDTADIYGDNEDFIGKWFKLHPERRKDIFLATKFGLKVSAEGIVVDSSPEHCKQSLEKSLQRLGVESIDLYYMHRADPNVPIEKTVQAMAELQK
jgi:aryl-alcohol dehydrogenase-like predicted oxidoreductase